MKKIRKSITFQAYYYQKVLNTFINIQRYILKIRFQIINNKYRLNKYIN